ncbi:hypothetical protein Ade02nite_75430 [Paractinoplanes deccanensis]|uniref:Uncharacterized protein n=1 Tax=Paractinoplanes deccanensis TaxID=113561 RepID=A0ABQ3YFY4_9ACTN|nr:hypothetical protein Ade02nite_75430 [Actinoplanes deccanensis]
MGGANGSGSFVRVRTAPSPVMVRPSSLTRTDGGSAGTGDIGHSVLVTKRRDGGHADKWEK